LGVRGFQFDLGGFAAGAGGQTRGGGRGRISHAIAGVPQAMASISTRPNGSGQSIGSSNPIAPLRKSGFSLSEISPMNSTSGLDLMSGEISSS